MRENVIVQPQRLCFLLLSCRSSPSSCSSSSAAGAIALHAQHVELCTRQLLARITQEPRVHRLPPPLDRLSRQHVVAPCLRILAVRAPPLPRRFRERHRRRPPRRPRRITLSTSAPARSEVLLDPRKRVLPLLRRRRAREVLLHDGFELLGHAASIKKLALLAFPVRIMLIKDRRKPPRRAVLLGGVRVDRIPQPFDLLRSPEMLRHVWRVAHQPHHRLVIKLRLLQLLFRILALPRIQCPPPCLHRGVHAVLLRALVRLPLCCLPLFLQRPLRTLLPNIVPTIARRGLGARIQALAGRGGSFEHFVPVAAAAWK
mmetsp:Transcript_52068/g.106168  ORF Transcript_52068/g.106168 Transcript_52068/m.106168 type:complete len:315 (-) Transcript_52068:644-1588(-)